MDQDIDVVGRPDRQVPSEQWDAEAQQTRISDALARRNIEERRALRAKLVTQRERQNALRSET